MSRNDNQRETGARKYPAKTGPDSSDDFVQKAAENKKPLDKTGLTKPVDQTNENTRQSDGTKPPRRSGMSD